MSAIASQLLNLSSSSLSFSFLSESPSTWIFDKNTVIICSFPFVSEKEFPYHVSVLCECDMKTWILIPRNVEIPLLKYVGNLSFSYMLPKDADVSKKQIKLKLVCNWLPSHLLASCWDKMSEGNGKWNHLQIVQEKPQFLQSSAEQKPDYYIIINRPLSEDIYEPSKSIVFRMEPDCSTNPYFNNWYKNKEDFLYFLDGETNRNNSEWHLNWTYQDFLVKPIPQKTKVLSSVMSSLYNMEGHKLRIDFLKYLEEHWADVPLDIYGKDNHFQFKHYKYPLPDHCKNEGIFPYKYTFIAENCCVDNYFTEKLIDPILGETLCFYWGCSNIETFLDPRAFVKLDLKNKEESFNIMKTMILGNEWEKRIDIIKKEKQKILNHYTFLPRIEGLLLLQNLSIILSSSLTKNDVSNLPPNLLTRVEKEKRTTNEQLIIHQPTKNINNFLDMFSFIIRIVFIEFSSYPNLSISFPKNSFLTCMRQYSFKKIQNTLKDNNERENILFEFQRGIPDINQFVLC